MTEIDRRALITATGAGLLVAACSDLGGGGESGNESGKESDNTSYGDGIDAGGCYLHGDPVNWPRPRYPQVEFHPDHLCVVYIQFTPDGLVVRIGYVESTATDMTIFRPLAAKILNQLKAKNYANLKFKALDFENFSLGSQQIVVFYIDNLPNYVEFAPDSNEDLEQIIRFSPFGAKARDAREANKAFYHLQKLTFDVQEKDRLIHNVAYSLDFWNTKANNSAIPDHAESDTGNHVIFSMNIHLLMHIKDMATSVPIILDPDTGNMGAKP